MKEQLISFDTAKLAKEKGFDIQTYSNCWVKTLDGDIIHNSERESKIEHDRCKQYLMQPSQTVLQKWLREKYKLHIHIADLGLYMWSFVITELFIDGTQGKEGSLKNYKTYEEALEKGLKEALKLIK